MDLNQLLQEYENNPEVNLEGLDFTPTEEYTIADLDPEWTDAPGLDSLDLGTQIQDFDLTDKEGSDEYETPVSVQVEDTFIGLICRGQAGKILELTNLELPSEIDRNVREQFCSLYVKAVAEVPALALYQRCLKNGIELYCEEGSESGELELEFKFPPNLSVLAFTDQVGHLLGGDLVIVDGLKDEREDALEQAKQESLSDFRVTRNDNTEDTDVDVTGFEFNEHRLSDLLANPEETDLDLTKDDEADQTQEEALTISLIDYSNKSIAEYLVANEGEKSEDQIRTALENEHFPKQRVTEILGIMKYLKVNSTLEGKLGIDRRTATEEFKFPES